MSSKIHDDLREIDQAGFISNKFGGGNAGAALGGSYVAKSNYAIARAITALTTAVNALANRPINVTVQLPPQATDPQGQDKLPSEHTAAKPKASPRADLNILNKDSKEE